MSLGSDSSRRLSGETKDKTQDESRGNTSSICKKKSDTQAIQKTSRMQAFEILAVRLIWEAKRLQQKLDKTHFTGKEKD